MGWVGNNSGINSTFFRGIWSNKTSQTSFLVVIFSISCLIFSQYLLFSQYTIPNALSFRKINSGSTTAGTASKIQYLNIIQISKYLICFVKNRQLVFKPWLFAEIWVSQNPGFVHGFSKNFPPMDFPPHGFPTPWILDFRGGRGSGRQKPRLHAKAESPDLRLSIFVVLPN